MSDQLALTPDESATQDITPEQAMTRSVPMAEDDWSDHLRRALLVVEHALPAATTRDAREECRARLVTLLRWAGELAAGELERERGIARRALERARG
jgi:hypothetical protein